MWGRLSARSICWVPYASVMLVAAWFTAGAIGLLAIFVVVTAVFAKKAFDKQSVEVGLSRTRASVRPVNAGGSRPSSST